MVRIMGYSANLDNTERMALEELTEQLRQFEGRPSVPKTVFIFRRREIKLHGIRFSSSKNEVQFLLKDAS